MDKENSVESFEQFALFIYRLWLRLQAKESAFYFFNAHAALLPWSLNLLHF